MILFACMVQLYHSFLCIIEDHLPEYFTFGQVMH
jgi:hypothetical protein